MNRFSLLATFLVTAAISAGCSSDDSDADTNTASLTPADGTSFFVTSQASATGNLGGLAGADKICTDLATAAGAGNKVWKAYLSTSTEDAKDRIGAGPWFNFNKVEVAASVAALHTTLKGNSDLLITEKGVKVNGQWNSSNGMNGAPVNEHDILTGSTPEGTAVPADAMGRNGTCSDWTSSGTDAFAQVGHSDGMGPMMATDPPNLTSWNSAHANQDCSNTAPRGGAGRFYCFATGKK
jgi:hypothetical protein